MKRIGCAVLLAVACVLSVAQSDAVEAQVSYAEARKLLDTRGKRSLLINNVAFLDSFHPVITAGSLLQISFRKAHGDTAIVIDLDIDDETGAISPDTIVTFNSYAAPSYYMHLLHTSGIATGGDESGAVGYLQLGVLKRRESKFPRFVGIAAQAIYEPWRAGPVVRMEIMDDIGINFGWMFDDDDDDDDEGVYVSLDYFIKLLEDLNLSPGS